MAYNWVIRCQFYRSDSNLTTLDILVQRGGLTYARFHELPSPIQMCDALSRNLPAELRTIVANCLAHGRRQFVDVAEQFPEECRHVLEVLAAVYHNDAIG